MDEDAEFHCLVPFPDGSPSFVHGFEAGMIWQRMSAGESFIGGRDEIALHTANAEVFQRMAAAADYDIELSIVDENWMTATFSKRPKRFVVINGGK